MLSKNVPLNKMPENVFINNLPIAIVMVVLIKLSLILLKLKNMKKILGKKNIINSMNKKVKISTKFYTNLLLVDQKNYFNAKPKFKMWPQVAKNKEESLKNVFIKNYKTTCAEFVYVK